jgi:putative hydrolase of the HAD superfamily
MRGKAVFFDVDFTLIHPGPTFLGEGYRDFCARHGMEVDPSRFERAVASAASLLDTPEDLPYDDGIYIAYTRHIIEQMGGRGETLDACAREVYAEWAACRHFELYDDVAPTMRSLGRSGVRLGLISNSHRCLASFQTHFALDGLISAAVSSSQHGMMKPHASIFKAALELVGVGPEDALMVGDSVRQDVDGAVSAGMRAVLLNRSSCPHPRADDMRERGVPIITSLHELPHILSP